MKNEDVAALEELEAGHWWGEERANRLVSLVEASVPKNGRVLEVGCGTGKILYELSQRNYKCFGIEPSKSGYSSSNQLLPDRIFNGTLEEYLSTEVTWGEFDCVLLFDVLEHIEDDLNALKSISPLLQSKGLIIFSVPADPKLWSRLDKEVFHFRRYTLVQLKQLASMTDLRLTYSLYWCSILKVPIKIYRRVFNPSFAQNIKKPHPIVNNFLRVLIRIERLDWFGQIPGVSIFGIFHKSN
jgi:SAM-dependent methyltransferase